MHARRAQSQKAARCQFQSSKISGIRREGRISDVQPIATLLDTQKLVALRDVSTCIIRLKVKLIATLLDLMDLPQICSLKLHAFCGHSDLFMEKLL